MLKPIVAVLALVSVLLTGVAAADPPSPSWLTTPCPNEDSVNCYWDADVAGDGEGHSFFAVRVRGEVCVLYAERRYARRHNHCIPLDRS